MKFMSISSSPYGQYAWGGGGGTYFWAPALEFSTLLEVTEAGTILVHASCTRPTRCPPFFWVLRG